MMDSEEEEEQTALVCDNGKKIQLNKASINKAAELDPKLALRSVV